MAINNELNRDDRDCKYTSLFYTNYSSSLGSPTKLSLSLFNTLSICEK